MKKILFAPLLFTSSVNAQTDSLKREIDLMINRQEVFVRTHNAGVLALGIGFAGLGFVLASKKQDESLMIASGCLITTGYVFTLYAPNKLRRKRK